MSKSKAIAYYVLGFLLALLQKYFFFLYEAHIWFQADRKWRRLKKLVHRSRVIARMG